MAPVFLSMSLSSACIARILATNHKTEN